VPKRFTDLETGTCGTGDSFETGTPKVSCDVVDMEAYAYAKVCQLEGIEFVSLKYISDGSDHNAHNDWTENVSKAAVRFFEFYPQVITRVLK
jgi:adenosylhomocysteine nucleosidase